MEIDVIWIGFTLDWEDFYERVMLNIEEEKDSTLQY